MIASQEQISMVDELLKEMNEIISKVWFDVKTEDIPDIWRVTFSGTVYNVRLKARDIGLGKMKARQWTLAEYKAFIRRVKLKTTSLLFIQE